MNTNASNTPSVTSDASPRTAPSRADERPSIDDVIGGALLLTLLCATTMLVVDGSRLITM